MKMAIGDLGSGKKLQYVSLFLSAIAILSGLNQAVRLRWTTDDAYISFRYAKNLIDGYGLVFNQGEYVEGFTNFLWTIMVAGGMKAGFFPEPFAIALGLLFFAGILFVLYRFSSLFQGNKVSWFPVAAMMFAVNHHAEVFATSGLETSFYGFLVVLGSYFLYRNRGLSDQALGLAILALSAMTRPDGLLFYALASLFLLQRDWKIYKSDFKYFLKIHSFMLAVFLPYWIWRMNYYGWLFPNTFYAKSGNKGYLKQGINYFILYFSAYYVYILLPVAAVYARVRKISIDTRIVQYVLVPALMYGGYYTYVGGDFMFGRFYFPVVILLSVAMEYYIRKLFGNWQLVLAGTVLILMAHNFKDPYKGELFPVRMGIVDENIVYKPKQRNILIQKMKEWRDVFHKKNIRLAIYGSQALYAYYLEPPYVLEAATGLTDEYLAHRKVTERGIIGHEKAADMPYLRKRDIDITMGGMDFPDHETDYNKLAVRPLIGYGIIVKYDREKMTALAGLGDFEFVDFEKYLDRYIRDMKNYPVHKIRKDFEEFRIYYFNHNNDPRAEAFYRVLGR